MAQQLLYLPDIGAALQQVSGAGVTQRVRRDVLSDASAVRSFGDDAHNIVVIEWTTGTTRDKQTHLAGFAHEQTARCF